MEQEQKELVSCFRDVTSHEAVTVEVAKVVEGIRSGRWKDLVTNIRRELAKGDKKAASDLKRRLPYISFGGIFEGGHKASQLRRYSFLNVLDFDDIPPEELERLRALAMTHASVLSTFITPSGRGLKLVIRTRTEAAQHAAIFARVTCCFEQLLGYKSDPSCKDISRGHFVSSDPDATFNPDAIPWENAEGDEEGDEEGEIETFVRSFLVLYPAREGNRNNQLYRLSLEARKRGIAQDALLQTAVKVMSAPDFAPDEMAVTVRSAYLRTLQEESEKGAWKVPEKSQSALVPKEKEKDLDLSPLKADGEALREQTPTFPDTAINALPDLLKQGLKYVCDKRERDMLLLAMITVISSLLHHVTAYYARKRYWANLYTFIVAGAASNKGVAEYALSLCKYYFKDIADANDRLEQQYEKEMRQYEEESRKRSRQKTTDNPPQVPQEPAYRYPLIPSDISKSRLMIHMRDNKDMGGLMFDLEAETLYSAGKQDYGNFFDLLRKFFQHESVSSSFKANGKPIYIPCPRLSVLLAGTPAQFACMIPYSENGLLSRFDCYTLRQPALWKDVSPAEQEDEVEKHFDQLAMRLNRAIHFLDGSPTRVRLTKKQWNCLNKTFAALLAESEMMEQEDFQSCVKRHGLMTMRMCMVFTALEKSAMQMPAEEMLCTDEHFEAALSLVTTCLEHSRLLITSIQSRSSDIAELSNPYKTQNILEQLSPEFSAADFMKLALSQGMTENSAKKMLHRSIGLKIKRIKWGWYKKLD